MPWRLKNWALATFCLAYSYEISLRQAVRNVAMMTIAPLPQFRSVDYNRCDISVAWKQTLADGPDG